MVGGGAGYAPPFTFTPKWQYGVTGSYHLSFTSLVHNEPRMFGFSLKYRFGGA